MVRGAYHARRETASTTRLGENLGAYDKKVRPKQNAAKQEGERFKERRNPSADAHGEPMSGG
jgi:hypothetical protein